MLKVRVSVADEPWCYCPACGWRVYLTHIRAHLLTPQHHAAVERWGARWT